MTPLLLPCTKCLTSIDLLFKNQNLSPAILDEFIYDSLIMSMNHFHLIKGTLSSEKIAKYYMVHAQVELLLAILRRLQLNA